MATREETKRRRALIIRRLAGGTYASDIARELGISKPAISVHLKAMGFGGMTREERQEAALGIQQTTSTKKPEPDARPPITYLAPPYDPPSWGCRYYLAKQRRTCGKPKTGKNYCDDCTALVSPMVKL